MAEQWKPIQGLEGKYEISNMGRVKRLQRTDSNNHVWPERILDGQVMNNGYARVSISVDGCVRKFAVHRLVAEAFLDKPENCDIVNHLDCNPSNNRADNLEWTTYKGNMEYATSLGRMRYNPVNLKKAQESKKIPVIAISKDGTRTLFESSAEAARKLGITSGHIAAACRKEYGYKTVGGYEFEYADEELQKAQKPKRVGKSKTELADDLRKRMLGNKYGLGKSPSDETRRKISEANGTPCVQLTKDGVFVNSFISCNDAFKKTGIRHINDCVSGKRSSAGGFLWVSKETYDGLPVN